MNQAAKIDPNHRKLRRYSRIQKTQLSAMGDQWIDEPNTGLAQLADAGQEDLSENAVIELVEERIEPAIKGLIRRKLHVSLRFADESQVNQDALELAGEVKTLILAKLTNSGPETAGIGSLEAYAKTVATNSCNQYLRKKFPHRLRLKNQLRYLLAHHRRLAEWQENEGEWLCGIDQWQHKNISTAGTGWLTEEAVEKLGPSTAHSNLVDLVIAIFNECGAPLRFADLLSAIYQLKDIREPVEVPEDEAAGYGHQSDVAERLEQTEFLRLLWDEVSRLPPRHRCALFLNLRSQQGDGLIAQLPLSRIASVRQIAEVLEFPIEQFVQIWSELPWDDQRIAGHLGLTRQQVINLRQSARASLRRRLNYS